MVLSQVALILDQSFRKDSTLFLSLGNILFEALNLVLIFMVVSDKFEGLGLFLLDFHKSVFLVLQGLKLFLQIFELILFTLNTPAIIDMLKLSFDDKDFVF
jgi:hypothetical protein